MLSKKQSIKLALFTGLGGLLGYGYYYFIGCTNGCVLQSNPTIMTLYGAFTGGILGLPSRKKKPAKEQEETN